MVTTLGRLQRDDLFSYFDKHGRPGWRFLSRREEGNFVILRLPCGHVVTLGADHKVFPDGRIEPPIRCATKERGDPCKKFSDFVILKGFNAT